MKTDELISTLTKDPLQRKPLAAPLVLWSTSVGLSLLYTAALIGLLGIRSDIHAYMMQPFSFIEIWLLLALLASSLWSAICHVYPDQYGGSLAEPLPFILFGLLILILMMQVESVDIDVFMQQMSWHLICLSCLTAASIIPSIALFILTQRGASVSPVKSGIYIVFAAVSIGCIALRLHETTYDMTHIILSHYAPLFLFAALGALLGHLVLKW